MLCGWHACTSDSQRQAGLTGREGFCQEPAELSSVSAAFHSFSEVHQRLIVQLTVLMEQLTQSY